MKQIFTAMIEVLALNGSVWAGGNLGNMGLFEVTKKQGIFPGSDVVDDRDTDYIWLDTEE